MKDKIIISNINFLYDKNNIIFEGANIELEKGKVYLLTGENGSGKSTLLRMLAGLIACDKMCDIRWFGEKISSFSKLKNKIIYVKEAPYLYDYLTGKENLELLSEVLEINEKERNIIIAHQFVTGASKCGSEEVSIGGLDNVDGVVYHAGTKLVEKSF